MSIDQEKVRRVVRSIVGDPEQPDTPRPEAAAQPLEPVGEVHPLGACIFENRPTACKRCIEFQAAAVRYYSPKPEATQPAEGMEQRAREVAHHILANNAMHYSEPSTFNASNPQRFIDRAIRNATHAVADHATSEVKLALEEAANHSPYIGLKLRAESAESQLADVVKVLREQEWRDYGPSCYCCGMLKAAGHKRDCWLSALLAKLTTKGTGNGEPQATSGS